MTDNSMDLVNKFRDDRNWRQFHNEKDLAISISLEASELLELFQWKKSDDVVSKKQKELKEELADVLIYSYMMADNLNLDVDERSKMGIFLAMQSPISIDGVTNSEFLKSCFFQADLIFYL